MFRPKFTSLAFSFILRKIGLEQIAYSEYTSLQQEDLQMHPHEDTPKL